jgi:hypothetical protein
MISVPSVKPFAVRSPMAEYVEFGTTRPTGTWGGNNTAGIQWMGAPDLTVEWGGTGWSGGAATQVYSVGGYGTNTQFISRAISGAGSKTIRCYPTDTSGRRIGKITQITLSLSSSTNTTTPLTSVDVKNARELNYLYLTTTNVSTTVTSLDVSGMKKLTTFILTSSGGGSSYTTSVNVTDCTSLTNLAVSGQQGITSVTGLSSLKNNLQTLSLRNSGGFTSLDVSDFGSLYNLDLRNCGGLTSLRAQNVMLYTTYYYTYGGYAYSLVGGADLQYTGLTGGGLNQFYTDLATETTANPARIAVFGAAGVGNNDPSIATAKNYTVVGNIPPI